MTHYDKSVTRRHERRMVSVAFLPFSILVLLRSLISLFENGLPCNYNETYSYAMTIVFLIMTINGAIGFQYLKSLGTKYQPVKKRVVVTKSLDCASVEYFVAIFIPLLMSDINSNGEALFFLALVLTIAALVNNSGIQYRNPMILICGYKTVECLIEDSNNTLEGESKQPQDWPKRIGLIREKEALPLDNQRIVCGVIDIGSDCAWIQLEDHDGSGQR